MPLTVDDIPGRRLAVAAETLFLANLLVAPGIAFLALLWMRRHYADAPALARCHIDQAFFAGLWSGVLLLVVTAVLLMLGGVTWIWTWVIVIPYFICMHASLILLGVLGLARAQAGRPYTFPLIRPRRG